MEFYYLSKYPIKICRDYMEHSNAYDRFIYTWEKKEGYYLITFKEFKSSTAFRSLANVRKPVFKVVFEDFAEQTGIRVQFISTGFIIKSMPIFPQDVDKFWMKKLDAKKIK